MSQENETKRDHDLHAAMDKLLLEHGAYIPVELLLHEGRLRYSDYEAWRCGEVDSLDDVLLGNPERIFKRLYQASEWAVSLGLEPDSQDYYAWGAKAGGRKLVFLHDNQQSEELLRTHYVRKQDLAPSPGQVSQLDLFLDSGATPIVNDIINALASRRLDDVEILLERLAEREPGHRSRHALDSLFAALYQLENSPDLISPEELLANLEKYLIPLAKELLGIKARDFLTPFWRQLAESLDGISFDPDRPKLHNSWVGINILEWESVRDSIVAEPKWIKYPELYERLAKAYYHLGEHYQAIVILCRLCWSFQEEAMSILTESNLSSPEVHRAWTEFLDLDVEPLLDASWFPAWLLLFQPGMARRLGTGTAPENTSSGRVFRALHDLLLLKKEGDIDQEMLRLRAIIKAEHEGLFRIYLSRFA